MHVVHRPVGADILQLLGPLLSLSFVSGLISTLATTYVCTSFSVVRSIDSKNQFDSSNRSSKICKVYSTLGLESLL